MLFRDEFEGFLSSLNFEGLYPTRGKPALPPWRLLLATILQFSENLTDRQAADAVKSRIDWKYALSLELSDPGFHYSVLSEFRTRILQQENTLVYLDALLDACKAKDLLKTRGKQRTDSTHVLASIRFMNRAELIFETLRAALNALAEHFPEWLHQFMPSWWYRRFNHRSENYHLPRNEALKKGHIEWAGGDGYFLLYLLKGEKEIEALNLPALKALEEVWERHFMTAYKPS